MASPFDRESKAAMLYVLLVLITESQKEAGCIERERTNWARFDEMDSGRKRIFVKRRWTACAKAGRNSVHYRRRNDGAPYRIPAKSMASL